MSKNGLTKHDSVNQNGGRACFWDSPEAAENQYSLGVAIFDRSGYQDFDHKDFQISDHNVGGHTALLIQDPTGGTCELSIAVTASSHVIVNVTPSNGGVQLACSLAEGAAGTVEQNLPG